MSRVVSHPYQGPHPGLTLTRRSLLLLGVAFGSVAALRVPPAAAQQAGPTEAVALAFVRQTADSILHIINDSQDLAAKQKQLLPLIDQDVDVDGIARFCLGRFWNRATPQQQQQYTTLFHSVLVNSITGRLGDYAGVTIDIGKAHAQGGDGVVVATTITRPNNAPASVDWLITSHNGQTKIADMIAENTSLRVTQRDDYASFLGQHGGDVKALIDALRKQLSS
jgi:phospholipid transport system substrate-binding protein